jgi:hypothetical protein
MDGRIEIFFKSFSIIYYQISVLERFQFQAELLLESLNPPGKKTVLNLHTSSRGQLQTLK